MMFKPGPLDKGFVLGGPTREMLRAATMLAPTWDDNVSREKWQAMLAVAIAKATALPPSGGTSAKRPQS